MSNRAKLWLLGSVILILICMLVGVAAWKLPQFAPDAWLRSQLLLLLIGGAALISVFFAAVWIYLDWACFVPMRRLARDARAIVNNHADYEVEISDFHLLGDLPQNIRDLSEALHKARREVVAAMANGAREFEEQKSRLDIVLRELSEGVVVCDADGYILLFNPAALKLLSNPDALVLGRSLYELWTRAPIENTLDLLRHKQANTGDGKTPMGDAEFVCATVAEELLLHCRMSLLPALTDSTAAFVITFRDLKSQLQQAGINRPKINVSIEDLRRPLANLRAAAENLSEFSDMEQEQQQAFQRVILAESGRLSKNLETLSQELRALFATQWPMNDVYSVDLLASVAHRLQRRIGSVLTLIGEPLWLHVDSHSIMLLVEHLIEQLHKAGAAKAFEVESLLGNRRVYLDIIWHGRPIPMHQVQAWSEQRLQELAGATTVGDVLHRHNSELWSQLHRRAGRAVLRLPLPASRRQWQSEGEILAERPEFYDFSLGRNGMELGELAERSLSELSYVALGITTTGLKPSQGDEIIQLAGVRIVERQMLPGKMFERLVNPGKPISNASIRFHGISDEMVKDKPGIEKVMLQFRQFVGGDSTVLLAHNAAFVMKFLRVKEDNAAVRFANPVLDTLLLSAYLHDYTDAHTLKAIAGRLGVSVDDQDTAPGDALITAQVFVRLLNLLEAQGVHTLGEALAASEKMAEIRRMQAQF